MIEIAGLNQSHRTLKHFHHKNDSPTTEHEFDSTAKERTRRGRRKPPPGRRCASWAADRMRACTFAASPLSLRRLRRHRHACVTYRIPCKAMQTSESEHHATDSWPARAPPNQPTPERPKMNEAPYTRPPMAPMTSAEPGVTLPQGAVIDTRPEGRKYSSSS